MFHDLPVAASRPGCRIARPPARPAAPPDAGAGFWGQAVKPEELLVAVSPDAPCGEDLLAADDPDFVDYYFNVEDRLPTSYFNLNSGTLFDSRSVDHKGEAAQIEALLKRSRDLRLLGIQAKFQILAGRFKGWCEAVEGMIALMREYPGEVHPTDPVERQNALEELNANATIVAPLDYAVLLTDRRAGDIIYRGYGTATGKLPLREGEEAGETGRAIAAFGSSDNIAAVDALYATLTGIRDGLKAVTQLCQTAAKPFTPRFDRLGDKLDGMIAMIEAARSDLAGGAEEDVAPAEDTFGEETGAEGVASVTPSGVQTITITATVGEIADHRAAFRALRALETYFVAREPSSLALILVTQSRILIGRPLVEAIDALLENNSNYATLSFDTEQGFSLSMYRMRDLANQAGIPSNETLGEWQEGDPDPVEIVSREHAGAVLKQVEDFFRQREPASPIPVLLFKARNFLTKDFHSLVRELLPPSTS